jgi:hypothetical protein
MDGLEFYMGNLRQVHPKENETLEELRIRLWVACGNDPEGILSEEFEPYGDLEYTYFEHYIQVKGKIFEIYDEICADEEENCEVTKKENENYSFKVTYYDSAQDMIAKELAKIID